MSTQPPLTEAEGAAFAEMLRHGSPTECWCGDNPCDECSAAARAVVAAVRPITDAEALADAARVMRRALEDDEYAEQVDIYFDEKAAYGVVTATKQLEAWAQRLRQSLSRPTSEETQK